ncbi:hypothetical protein AB0I53_18750 [Saccharopolyspora sp. NPDC050389]|uniref:hypothetical protein n=1 Tax=Saccharopolyspora sp. NPDC050389 TaxID=3155516 RepID=UPI0033D9A1A4
MSDDRDLFLGGLRRAGRQDALTQNLLYILSSTAVVLALLGLILIDTGLVRRQNVLTTSIQKIIGFRSGSWWSRPSTPWSTAAVSTTRKSSGWPALPSWVT